MIVLHFVRSVSYLHCLRCLHCLHSYYYYDYYLHFAVVGFANAIAVAVAVVVVVVGDVIFDVGIGQAIGNSIQVIFEEIIEFLKPKMIWLLFPKLHDVLNNRANWEDWNAEYLL